MRRCATVLTLLVLGCTNERADFARNDDPGGQKTDGGNDSRPGDKHEAGTPAESDDDSGDKDPDSDPATIHEAGDQTGSKDEPTNDSADDTPADTSQDEPGSDDDPGSDDGTVTEDESLNDGGRPTDGELTSDGSSSVMRSDDAGCTTECCANADCASGMSCVDSACTCDTGTELCNDTCIAESECCTNDDCPESGSCVEGACECNFGTHFCGEICASDTDVATCGARCEPCPAPIGGTAGCAQGECTASCSAGQKLCAGTCIPDGNPCDASCMPGNHDCGGVCVLNDTASACGPSCTVCTAPQHALPICANAACDFTCSSGYMRCDDACVVDTGCCEDDDCNNGKVCNGANACECADGTKPCGDQCIPDSGCCGDGDCASGFGCEDNQCVDDEPPTVVSRLPANGADGIASNTSIQITFSEPMDQESVKDALTITSLASSAYSLSWNGVGTVLTIQPNAALVYNTTSSIDSGSAKQYTTTVAATARDLAGNRLAAASSSVFSTLRRVTQTVTAWEVASQNGSNDPVFCPTASNNLRVGRSASNDYHIWVLFELEEVGTYSQVTTFESAKFKATQGTAEGAYYPNGQVHLYRDEANWTASDLFDVEQLQDHGTLASSAAASLSVTLNNFASAWEDSQSIFYELTNVGSAAASTYAIFPCSAFSLELVFLVP